MRESRALRPPLRLRRIEPNRWFVGLYVNVSHTLHNARHITDTRALQDPHHWTTFGYTVGTSGLGEGMLESAASVQTYSGIRRSCKGSNLSHYTPQRDSPLMRMIRGAIPAFSSSRHNLGNYCVND